MSGHDLVAPIIMEETLLESLRGLNIAVIIFSRVPQIISNFRNSSTGALSLITTFLQFAGSVARVFTTLADESNYNEIGIVDIAFCLSE